MFEVGVRRSERILVELLKGTWCPALSFHAGETDNGPDQKITALR